MKKITWVKISHSKKYGGTIYGEKVQDIIKKNFNFQEITIHGRKNTPRPLRLIEWFFKFMHLYGHSDLWIEDSFIAVAMTNFQRIQGKTALLIYHIDNSIFSGPTKYVLMMLEKVFYRKAKKADIIITISEYWKQHFLRKGYHNVVKVYNSFNPTEFVFTQEELQQFKDRYQLGQKPIVYIGNCQKAKGVIQAYEALKHLDVTLVTSGDQHVALPAKNVNGSHRDYLRLLKVSTVVVTMSLFKEGWCATAHEAMLCKIPVVGSGLGGMRELLEGGKQIVCLDFKDLAAKVEYLLCNERARITLGEDGYQYAQTLNHERFEKDWVDILSRLLI